MAKGIHSNGCRALLFLLVFGCRAVPVFNAQFGGAGEGGSSVTGCHCPGSSALLEQGSFSLDGMAPPCVDRAGWWETNLVYILSVEWITDPFVLVHAYSDSPVAMLPEMLNCVVWWSALVGHCPLGALPNGGLSLAFRCSLFPMCRLRCWTLLQR